MEDADPNAPPELFPFIDFDADQAGVFVNGDFLTCAEER